MGAAEIGTWIEGCGKSKVWHSRFQRSKIDLILLAMEVQKIFPSDRFGYSTWKGG